METDDRTVLALDLGATQIRVAAITPDGAVRSRRNADTPVRDGPDAVVAACIRELQEVRAAWEARPEGPRAEAIGISAPGPVDPSRGVIIDPPNMGPRFRDVELAGPVAAALGLPTVLDRDTQVAALAEGAHGAARGCADFLYITVSSGIGGAIVSDGRLLRGPDGAAGELGHILVDRGGPLCGCGARGHLEAIASGVAVAARAREVVEGGAGGMLPGLMADRGAAFGARDVALADEAGDPLAGAILANARDAFAQACVGLVDTFNPTRIVVGGSLARNQGERWLQPARDRVAREAFRVPGNRVEIVAAELGDDVGLVGGLELVRARLWA